jgi:hypothetical protein
MVVANSTRRSPVDPPGKLHFIGPVLSDHGLRCVVNSISFADVDFCSVSPLRLHAVTGEHRFSLNGIRKITSGRNRGGVKLSF